MPPSKGTAGAASDGLPREIERKYLLHALPPHAAGFPPVTMEQGYVPGTQIHERVRREVDGDTVTLTRTIKLGRGVSRIEVEEAIDAPLFAGLWALTVGARVQKRRHRVPDESLVWELDDFTDRALVLAEVELPSESTEVTLPAWLAPFVVREVTSEPAYLNLRLAR
jgi:CYTH domain-containing protein